MKVLLSHIVTIVMMILPGVLAKLLELIGRKVTNKKTEKEELEISRNRVILTKNQAVKRLRDMTVFELIEELQYVYSKLIEAAPKEMTVKNWTKLVTSHMPVNYRALVAELYHREREQRGKPTGVELPSTFTIDVKGVGTKPKQSKKGENNHARVKV